MKVIVAFVRPEKMEALQEELDEPGVGLVAVSQAVDPREPCARSRYRGLAVRLPRPRLRVEVVVVNEALLGWAVDTIARAAASGDGERLGSGDILVMPLDDHIRIPDRAPLEPALDDTEPAASRPPFDLGRLRP